MCISLVSPNNHNHSALFFLQWHITSSCDQACKHCYMYDSPFYNAEKQNPLSKNDCIRIIDDYAQFVKSINVMSGIAFTGGDPLLREDFFDLLDYSNKAQIDNFTIIGNPYHVTPSVAQSLKNRNVSIYQISIDGMEATHDFFRKKRKF